MSLGRLLETTVTELLERLAAADYYPTPIIDLGVLMAHTDGRIDAEELAVLRELFSELLGLRLRGRVAQLLIDASLEVINQAGVQPRLRLIAEILRDCDAVEEGLIVAASLAMVSAGLTQNARRLLEQLAEACGVTPAQLRAVITRVEQEPAPMPVSSRISLGLLPQSDDSQREL